MQEPLKWIIGNAQKGLRGVDNTYKNESKIIDNMAYSIDFSQIYIYIQKRPVGRWEYRLLDYIFNGQKKRSFNFTLLPPAIYELRRYLDNLVKSVEHVTPAQNNEKSRFSQLVNEINNIDTKGQVINKSDRDLIKAKLIEISSSITKDDYSRAISTKLGFDYFISRPLTELKSLFQEDIILNPFEIEGLSDSIQFSPPINDTLYQKCLDKLDNDRKYKYMNNFIDAWHALYPYYINDQILKNKSLLRIFTGSPLSLSVYETNLVPYYDKTNNAVDFNPFHKKNMFKLSYVKCPVYLGALMFCENVYNDAEKRDQFIRSSLNILGQIDEFPQYESFIDKIVPEIQTDDEKTRNKRLDRLHYSLKDSLTFIDVFLMNENYFELIAEKYRLYKTSQELEINPLVSIEKDSLNLSQIEIDEGLEAAREELIKLSSSIFIKYFDIINQFDYGKLSPRMKLVYDYLSIPPGE